jgi:ATP synthase subunit 6
MLFYSPLEQFEILVLFNISNYVIITSFIFSLFIIFFLLLRLNFFIFKNTSIFSTKYYFILQKLYNFIINEVYFQQTSKNATSFFVSLFFYIFIIVFGFNFFSLLPNSEALSAQFFVAIYLALTCNLGFMWTTLERFGYYFFKIFSPSGIPNIIMPLVIFTEVLSYLMRSLSMGLRLFANLMAGHTLLHILTSFATLIYISSSMVGFLLIIIIVLLVSGLELVIAFLQAYIFITLLSIYSNDVFKSPVH